MQLIINTQTNQVIGTLDGAIETLPNTHYLDPPADFDLSDLTDYQYDPTTSEVTRDPVAALNRTIAARKISIKKAAKQLIEALDWRLIRARERMETNTAGETVAEVLAMREAIRVKSSAAEAAIEVMMDTQSVQNFSVSL